LFHLTNLVSTSFAALSLSPPHLSLSYSTLIPHISDSATLHTKGKSVDRVENTFYGSTNMFSIDARLGPQSEINKSNRIATHSTLILHSLYTHSTVLPTPPPPPPAFALCTLSTTVALCKLSTTVALCTLLLHTLYTLCKPHPHDSLYTNTISPPLNPAFTCAPHP
jgi:hypothetical protein